MSEQSLIAGPWSPSDVMPAAFLELPGQLYAGDPHWLGEDSQAVARQFGPDSPWFAQADAACWLGVVPGEARLAGFYSGQQIDGARVAFFGFWESRDDLDANRRLFRALGDWAKAQGATRLYGPIDFSTFGSYRVRLDAFEAGAFPGEPWNPPYYPELLEQLGFSQRYRYLSTLTDTESAAESIRADYLRVKPRLEQHVRLETLDGDFWMNNLDELYGLVDQVFGGNFAYSRLSREAFEQHCGRPFAERLCPHSSVLARSPDGRIAGFFLVYPDYAPLLRNGNPQRLPLAQVNFAEHFAQLPRPRRALAKTGGVHPDFRELGLFTAMGCELSLRAMAHYDELTAPLVREDNNSRQFALRHGRSQSRYYALYQGAL